jgi:hypothetical protein
MHFSRWGAAPAPARRDSLAANSEISAASDDEAPSAAALTEASVTAADRRRVSGQVSNDAVIDVALAESAA